MTANTFEVRSTPRKGRGLFAIREVLKGGTILVEKILAIPLYSGRDDSIWTNAEFWADLKEAEETPGSAKFGQMERLVREYVKEVELEGFDKTSELRGAHPEFKDRLVDIFLTNRLKLRANLSWVGLGKYLSIINHACIPNVHLSSDKYERSASRMVASVKATKDIAAGEEITIGYLELSCEQESRQRSTFDFFNFFCACDTCEALDPAVEVMMWTLAQAYQTIQASIDISSGVAQPWIFFRNAANIERLLRQLKISDRRVGELWLDCAYVAAEYSDAVRARYSFRKATAWYQVAWPADSAEIEDLTRLSKMPIKYEKWGRTDSGASDLSYDPIVEDDERHTETLQLLFMTDYTTFEYRRIVAGADQNLSIRARLSIRKITPYYTAKMEDDARRMEVEAQRADFEAAEQRAQASRDALITQLDREGNKEAAQATRNVPQVAKKAKKTQKKQRGGKARVAGRILDANGGEDEDPTPKQEGVISLMKPKQRSSVDADTAAIAAEEGWETVTKRKERNAKGKGKQEALEANISTVEKRGDGQNAQDEGTTYLPQEPRNRARQKSTVQGEDQQSQEMVDIENPQTGRNRDREAGSSSAETEKGQVSINQGTANADVSSRSASGASLGQAVQRTDEVDKFGDCLVVAPMAQAASIPTVRRPHAASFPVHIQPLERDLKIARLRDKIVLRRAKIWKLEEEINNMQNELETLTTEAMCAADWEDVKANLRRI